MSSSKKPTVACALSLIAGILIVINGSWIAFMYFLLTISIVMIAFGVIVLLSSVMLYRNPMNKRTWEFLGISVFLEIIAGVLLGIRPEVFLNLRKVRFSPKEFIVLAIIPIIALIYIAGDFARIWFIGWGELLVYCIGLNTSPVWIGVAIGKALYIHGEVK